MACDEHRYYGHGACPPCFAALRTRLADCERERDRWKASRIQYQTIVYDCCNAVDDPDTARKGLGAAEDNVACRVRQLRADRDQWRERVESAYDAVELAEKKAKEWRERAEKAEAERDRLKAICIELAGEESLHHG